MTFTCWMIAGPDALVIKAEANHRLVAGVEFENRPDRGADLLALHVGGVTGDAKRANAYEGRDDRVVAAGARSLLCRPGKDANSAPANAKQFVDRSASPGQDARYLPLASESDFALNTLPDHLHQRLLDAPETSADLHVVRLTLANGRVIEDVAIVHCSIIACIHGKPFVWFDGSEVTSLEVTHRRWGAAHLNP